jgi:DNA topoisomerase VI subunit B
MSDIVHRLQSILAQAEAHSVKVHLKEEFDRLGSDQLAKLTSKALASWQSNYPPNSPQQILAQFEWNRRLTEKQVQSARFAAWVGLIGVVVGAVLAWLLSHP